jgi:hypothetical protein
MILFFVRGLLIPGIEEIVMTLRSPLAKFKLYKLLNKEQNREKNWLCQSAEKIRQDNFILT